MKKPCICITKDRDFYSSFFSIWVMMVLYNIITLGVNLADNVMINAYSEVAMSGVTAVNQVQFLFQQLMVGASDAAVVLGSQYWGQKNTKSIKRFAIGTLLVGAGLSLVLFILACIVPEGILSLFTDSPEIRAAGVEYLNVMKYAYLFFALTNLLLAVLRSVETVRLGFYVSLSTLVVNISLNYLLIEGNLGAPALGVTGAAIATLVARIVEFLIVLMYLVFVDKKLSWQFKDLFSFDKILIKDYLKLAAPMLVTSFLFGSSGIIQNVILGHMSDFAIAANSVSSTLFQLLKVAAVGAASAASILIGKAIGSGSMDKIKSYTQTLQIMFVGIGLTTALLLFALRVPVVNMYDNLTPESRRLALDFILVMCAVEFGMSYQMPTNVGIIRGGGDAKYVLIMDLISIWGIVVPLSFVAAFVWEWHPVAVIACLHADQIFKGLPAFIKANRYHWMKKLTRKSD